MVHKFEYLGLVACLIFISIFPLLVLAEIFEIDFIHRNYDLVNFAGRVLAGIIYLNCLLIYLIELKYFSFIQNLFRIVLVIAGVVIVPLYIGILHPLRIKENSFFSYFYWTMPTV
jgi:hypothetical protein